MSFFSKGKDGSLDVNIPKGLKELQLLAVTTDAQVHQPGEEVRVIIAGPTMAGQKVKLEVYQFDNLVFPAKEIELSAAGLALDTIKELKQGEYKIRTRHGKVEASHNFTVAPYTRSMLNAGVEEYSLENQTLKFKILINHLFKGLYEGQTKVVITCDFCKGQVIWSDEEAEIKHGIYENKVEIGGHTGPFNLQMITPDGETASIFFPNTERKDREKVSISNLGQEYSASLHPFTGSQALRDLQIGALSFKNTPVILEKVIAEDGQGQMRATTSLGEVKIVTINPITLEHRIFPFADVGKNELLNFPVDKPYSIVLVGALWVKPKKEEEKVSEIFQGGAFVFRPVKLTGELEVPSQAKPGQEIKVVVKASVPAEGIILVRDKGVDHRFLGPKLGSGLFQRIKSDAFGLAIQETDFEKHVGFLGGPPRVRRSFRLIEETLRTTGEKLYFASPQVKDMDSGHLDVAYAGLAISDLTVDELIASITPVREKELHIIHVEHFSIEEEKEIIIQLPEQIGEVETTLYLFSGLDYQVLSKTASITKDAYVEADTPVSVAQDDKILVPINYHLPGDEKAVLNIGEVKKEVSGTGTITHIVTGEMRELEISLVPEKYSSDRLKKRIRPLGRQTVTQSEMIVLKPGETRTGRIFIYPSPLYLQAGIVQSLCHYPYGCTEQTTSALYGLGMAWLAHKRDLITGGNGNDDIKEKIYAGTSRLLTEYKEFASSGRWGLWKDSKSDQHVSRQVAKNLSPFLKDVKDFPELTDIVERTARALIFDKVKDRELMVLNPEFATNVIETPEDAAATILWGEEERHETALVILRGSVQKEQHGVSWKGRSWAGQLETTAKVAAALFRLGDPLAYEALIFLSNKLRDGRFYSTTDTAALILMLSEMSVNGYKGYPKVKIDGQGKEVQEVLFGKEVVAINHPVMIRVDSEVEIDPFEVKPNFKFTYGLEGGSGEIKLGDRLTVTVTPGEKSICPIAHIYISGIFGFMEGGVNLQAISKPVTDGSIEIPIVAIRRGTGKIRVVLTDMYDSEKVGVIPGVTFTVS